LELLKENLKAQILEDLIKQGFAINCDSTIEIASGNCKNVIRQLHKESCANKITSKQAFVRKSFTKLAKYFASGTEIDISKFSPVLYNVEQDKELSELFRLTTLLWSVPVSQGFGRRLRYVVIDKHTSKLIGIFGVTDPVFNLKTRDSLIGWNAANRASNLYNVMDLFVVGAVPPYSNLLCGKLIAMLATSNIVREQIYNKYCGVQTTISKDTKQPHVVLMTTSSALGRSSLYNRISFGNRKLFTCIGETEGWGHFHFSDNIFKLMLNYLEKIDHPIGKLNRFGQGPNWKIRTIRTCLQSLGLPSQLLLHGVKRSVYIAPLASNYKEFLLGEDGAPLFYDNDINSIVEYFKKRWFIPRSQRCPEYLSVEPVDTLRDIAF